MAAPSSTVAANTTDLLAQADAARAARPRKAEELYTEVLKVNAGENDHDILRDQETALLKLGELFRDEGNAVALSQVILTARTLTVQAAKAKTAKLILTLINLFASLPESATEDNKGLTLILDEAITWARQTSRQHLAQSLSLSLASHFLAVKQYRAALTLLSQLTPELKRLDDKHLLTTIHLLSSLTYHRLHNLPKAKAELTSARTAAGSVYVGQAVQARLDLMSGVVNAEEGDWKTAYSYFFESFEGLCAVLEQEEKGGKVPRGAAGDGFGGGGGSLVVDWGMAVGSSGGGGAGMQALTALKYMLLCKIMLNAAEDVTTLLSVKLAAKYADHREVESMKAVARAHANRNLGEFRKALKDYREEFSQDPIIKHHLADLFDRLLEQNLLRIVEPYSVVEISYIASHVELTVQEVEGKLSQMILDKVLDGVLDQGRGCLVLFDSPEKEEGYEDAVKMIAEVGRVVESLWGKAIRA